MTWFDSMSSVTSNAVIHATSRAVGGTARIVGTLTLLALVSCRQLSPSIDRETEPHRIVWPPAPEPARIELVQIFGRASELGIQRSWWRRLGDVLTGGTEPHLIRPAGIAASGESLAVADAGGGIVDLYDVRQRQQRALTGCGDVAFQEPVSVAFWSGRLYVSDGGSARIHVFDLAGECIDSWKLPDGSRPAGLAVDEGRGRLYVAAPIAHQVLAFDRNGTVSLQIGRRGTDPGEFNFPGWLALDRQGRIYVTDALNFRVQIFAPDGTLVGSFGHEGDGSGDFARPKGIGIDADGHVYVVDALFDAVQIFDAEGRFLLAFAAHGSDAGQFWLPSGLTIAGDRIYVADSYNRRVQVFRYLGGPS